MIEMSGSPCSPEDIALVKVGDVFDGWNGGEAKGPPDFSVNIISIGDFRNDKIYNNDEEPRECVADTVDCEITILKGTFAGETMMLSSVVPSGYHLELITPLGGTTSIQLNVKRIKEWDEYSKKIVAKTVPRIYSLITLRKAASANGGAGVGAAAAAAGGAGGGGGNKRKNRRGTKRVRRTRRRSSRRHYVSRTFKNQFN